ncbi:MAG: ribose-phosphate pyrophosphokinase [Myxococcales bacterium]|nr:ribose-phosphate pyrophosphokinase [Myxococcales bacterium]
MPGLKVFTGSAHPALAQAICDALGLPLGRSTTRRFSNENLKVKIEENVREEDVFVVQPSCPPVSEGLVELLIMLDALKSASARRVTAVLPYYPYARSDKKDEPRISITARLVADLLEAAGADRVLTMDLHSPQIQGFFRIPSDQLTAVPLLCNHLRTLGLREAVVVAADVGEAKDAGRFAKRLDLPLAIVDKRRSGDDERARVAHLVGDVAGRDCIIVDDEIATGGTLFEATDFLLGAGARSVQAAIVHPVLSGPATARLRGSPLVRLTVTDTIPIPPEKQDPKIDVLSVAPVLAQAITRIHDGASLSDLFH